MSTSQEAEQLYQILNADAVHPAVLEGLQNYSADSKNELVARVAQTFEPAPPPRVLARLLFLLTDENRTGVTTAFLVNLRSPYPEARKACLYGLQKLEYPAIIELALHALRDEDDQVVAAACDLLLLKAKQDLQLWTLLQQVYAARKATKGFHLTNSLLEAHNIEQPMPDPDHK